MSEATPGNATAYQPLVSVVIPTYNRGPMLSEAISQVLGQTYSAVEALVVDDGSTDDTPTVMAGYDHEPRVRSLRREENLGAGPTRNEGIAAAKGEYVAFLDSDDLWEPHKLARQMELVLAEGFEGLLCTGTYSVEELPSGEMKRFGATSKPPQDCSALGLVRGNFVCTSSVLLPRAALEAVGGFEGRLRRLQDYHLWLRLAARYPVRHLDEPLVGYRFHDGNMTATDPARILPAMGAMWELLIAEHAEVLTAAGLTVRELRGEIALAMGRQCAYSGHHGAAALRYLESFARQPKLWTLAVAAKAAGRWLLRRPGTNPLLR